MKILIAEDDVNILNGLQDLLSEEGYTPILANNGLEALQQYNKNKPDFIILDIMMPKLNGYDVCKEIRKTDDTTPVMFLSAKSEEIDKVLGLELGADDYMMKPFGVKELKARIRAIYRRHTPQEASANNKNSFHLGDLEVFPDEFKAIRGDSIIELNERDTQLLAAFNQNTGKPLDRNTLFNIGWGIDHYANSRTLDQYISQLRKKIEVEPKEPKIIKTIHGYGYRYDKE